VAVPLLRRRARDHGARRERDRRRAARCARSELGVGHDMTNAASDEPVLRVSNLAVDFPSEAGTVNAVRGVSYEVRPGEVFGVVGESGSGKSVSALAVLGLLPPTARITGSVQYRGRELLGLGDAEMSKIRGRSIAMVFSDPLS